MSASATSGTDGRPLLGGALDDVNDGFHASYDAAREEAKFDAPVFVICADELVVARRAERCVFEITPRIFHVIKSVAHAPVGVFAVLHRSGADASRLSALRDNAAVSLASLAKEEGLDIRTRDDLRIVLTATIAFANDALKTPPSTAALEGFARELGKVLLRLTAAATQVQLAALDARVDEALAGLNAEERRGLQVVVVGDHQARARSLGMQYFQKRFGEREGADERVTYAEGVLDVDGALALVGTRRLDNAIAAAFFGDPKRLQRDVLGDAVHALLEKSNLPPIV